MSILKKPLITEKMTIKGEKFKQIGFIVDRRATKPEIKNAIEKMYSVEVNSINTMIYAGKTRSRFTKAGAVTGKDAAFKKAIITLKDGQTIDFYDNI